MRAWLFFMGVVLGWAVLGRLVLEADIVHPLVLGVVWSIGLIWLIGWSVGSASEATYMLKLIAGIAAVAVAIAAIITLLEYAG